MLKNKGIVFILISSLCFAVMNTFVKLLSHIPAHELIFFRSLISFVITVIALRNLKLPLFGNNKLWLIIRGVTGFIALSLFFVTIQKIPLANAVSIQYLSPLFTTIVAIFVLKEKVLNQQWLWFAVAILGVLVIKGFSTEVDWLWLGVGVLSAMFSGVAYTAIRKCRTTDHPLQVVLYFPLIALPITGALCIWKSWVMPMGIEWFYLLLIGIFTQIAQVFMTKALHSERISIITPYKYVGAVFAIGIGYLVFDESLSWLNLFGISLILMGVVFNTLTKKKA